MIIYLEGPDGSGKTTLVRELTVELGKYWTVDYQANTYIPTHPKTMYRISEKSLYATLRRMARDKHTVYIIDRGPISDIVYRVFDDYKTVTDMSKLLPFMQENLTGIFTIYCNSSKAEENMLKRGDENPIAIAKHKEITKVFNIVMSVLKTTLDYNIGTYDYNKSGSLAEIIKSVMYFCNMGMKTKKELIWR